ncbi:sensor histidine kinase [Nocardioides panzhihuensis]|uniref:histidine kinase n=1 Tax=Nocardioides panzhihuensis TaxID=860243 RepID=A0A7Z0DNR8_9ACTN|nr:histidine kinase [Nocardioides panzhihuensis]NYI78872.1 signal transduction histidine kinase [Nocardioides panzhihuensis]
MVLVRRWVYLVLGGALCAPYLLLVVVAVPLAFPGLVANPGTPTVALGSLAGGTVLAATAFLPVVRTLEAALVPHLVSPGLTVAEVRTGRDRWLGALWFVLHLTLGMVTSLLSVIAPPAALGLILAAVTDGTIAGEIGSVLDLGRGWAAPVAVGLIAGTLLVVWAATSLMGWAAPRMLGPDPETRLAELEARSRELTERARLARELHDSIGHALTVTTLQATAARRLVRSDPDFAEEALSAIEQTGRLAVADLDDFLGLLREETSPRSPQPTLADLDELVVEHRRAGLPVTLRVDGDVRCVAAVISREVFRIVQESLTNVHRHAGSVPTTVGLEIGASELTASVENQAGQAGPVASADRGGHGLAGVRERVELLGGQLRAGPGHEGGWAVRVTVPKGSTR